ncbi:MAG: hypothetical protein FJX72_19090 [Armatimonadetes bacterium]|nr:hypothetical protein [Armatimonadota bacterium]
MRRSLSLLLVGLLLLSILGCWRHAYTAGAGAPMTGEPRYDKWHHHFLFALVGKENLRINEICPSGNATINEKVSFTNGLVAMLCLGGLIYYPSTVEVCCADTGKTGEIDLPPEKAKEFVMSEDFVEMVRDVAPEREGEVVAAQKHGPLAN